MKGIQNGKGPHELILNAVNHYMKYKEMLVICIIPHERGAVK